MSAKKTIFLTGAAGGMGIATINEFLKYPDKFTLRILDLPTPQNKEKLKKYEGNKSIEFMWGDLRNDEDIWNGVNGADYVLAVGVLGASQCDEFPEDGFRTNYGSTKKIIEAIKAQPNPDNIRMVYIGTVAMTGDRMPPIHWGRVGDPIKPSIYDYYATSKVAAERAVIESGLKHWVSLRQTGIMPIGQGGGDAPIVSHQPLNNVLEFISVYDSARLMVKICEENVPEIFWRSVYNMGGGESWRKTTIEGYDAIFSSLGIDYRETFEPNWYARFNFHGQWFLDSDKLDHMMHYRTQTYEQFQAFENKKAQEAMQDNTQPMEAPTAAQIYEHNQFVFNKPGGVLNVVENRDTEGIKVWFGSQEEYEAIPGWDKFIVYRPIGKPIVLDHGYDETKPAAELDLEDVQGAAKFRGGKCLSAAMEKGEMYKPLEWECAFGHQFTATPYLVLKGGHWCDECERGYWNYGEIAKVNPFFAQVWTPLHGAHETYKVKKVADDLIVK